MLYWTALTVRVVGLWPLAECGILPYAGGLWDQPAVLAEALQLFMSELGQARCAKAEVEKERARRRQGNWSGGRGWTRSG